MRSILLFGLALLTSTGSAQELQQQAPLEAIRPRSMPIELKEDPPPPPPPRKVIRKKLPAPVVNAPAPTQAVTIPTKSTPKLVETPARVERRRVVTPAPLISEPALVIEKVASPVSEKPTAPVVQRIQKTTTVVTETSSPPAAIQSAKGKGHGGGRRRALLNFRVASIYAKKKSTGSGSFILGWDPVILPYGRFNFGLSFGATRFESEALPSQSAAGFFVYEYGVATSYYVTRNFLPELVVGMQTWKESSKTTSNLWLAFNANYLFRRRPMGGHLDRLYAGYGMLNTDGGATHIIRAGIGFRF